jgi:branched-chain amino acid transport system ATP-binding protein
LDVDSGTVALDGADITHVKRHKVAARGLCHVPDGRGVFPALTVRENIQLFGRNLRGSDAAEMAVEAFPSLARRLDALAGSLSGGERQMLALVRPWIHKPPVVLLDEISMGLAPLVIDDVYLFLSRLSANGCALLIVEQYIGRVRELATHVYLMSKGQIAFSGLIDALGDEQEVIGHYFGSPQ